MISWRPIALVLLGATLGTAVQVGEQASMGLRVPSMFAAFFMVAHGLYELDRAHGGNVPPAQPAPAKGGGKGSPRVRVGVPVALMALASWLGLANLTSTGAPGPLSFLAVLAAFLLFSLGWSVLVSPTANGR